MVFLLIVEPGDFNYYPKYAVPVGLVIVYNITSMPAFVTGWGEFSEASWKDSLYQGFGFQPGN
jgi:hypothetical protein